MFIKIFLSRIFNDPVEIWKLMLEICLIYVIIRFRHTVKTPEIDLSENLVTKLIQDYEPEELITNNPPDLLFNKKEGSLDLVSYDVFSVGGLFKEESKEIIKEYGIGTCGPPTFFGTLDLHLDLQDKISDVLGTEDSLLYSNSYTCAHSVISCFSTKSDTIFYHKHSNEAIIRGVTLSKSRCYEYDSVETLKNILKLYLNPKRRNFVIVEGLSKNEGKIIALESILQLKKAFNFFIILDESLSIPLLNKRGVCGYFNINPKLIDIRIGSFSYGYTSNGGFFTGSNELTNYQRLSSSAYVFSASLPGVLANFNKLALDLEFDYGTLRKKIKKFHKYFISSKFSIVSDIESPIILIRLKLDSRVKSCKLLLCYKIVNILHQKNIQIGININPEPTLRVVIKNNLKNIKKLAGTISNACMNH